MPSQGPKIIFKKASILLAHGIRESLPLILTICFYPLIPIVINSHHLGDQDEAIAAIDRFLFGGIDPIHSLESVISGSLSEWTALAYTFYGFMFLIVIGVLFIRNDRKPFRHFSFVICLGLSLGYIGYSLVPVRGPLSIHTFTTSLQLHYLDQVKTVLMDKTRINRDCFPSLHTAISLLLLWECWRYARVLFWTFLPFVITIPFACVYLRYHYVTDVIAGVFLSIFVILFTNFIEKKRSTHD